MVPLENKLGYLSTIKDSPKLTSFRNLLFENEVVLPANKGQNDSDKIYFGLIIAIQTNDKQSFENYFNKKNKSNPTKESPSPFINDDFLIFSLIVGIAKFGLDKKWTNKIVSLRSRNPLTITFDNIINENYFSKSNLPEVVLMFFKLINQSLITSELLTITFKSVSNNATLFENKSDFQILCALRSYDLIIELKETSDVSEIICLKEFNIKFLKRIKILTWLSQTIIIIFLFYALYKIVLLSPAIKSFLDNFNSTIKILGLVGISQFGNIIPVFKRNINTMILTMFGYPKALIRSEIKSENK